MEPYLFPYVGYFQLIQSVDKLIFYDDVNFKKNGWINRNRILINGQSHYFTVQLKGASSFKPICEVGYTDNRSKLVRSIEFAYKKAPYFKKVMPLVAECLTHPAANVAELAVFSLIQTSGYLGIGTQFERSSQKYSDSRGMEKNDRLCRICRQNKADTYINVIGGRRLFSEEKFELNRIKLFFIQSKPIEYKQYRADFVPGLSIIDVMMFNSREDVKKTLEMYELVRFADSRCGLAAAI
jgi:hypothetical protein